MGSESLVISKMMDVAVVDFKGAALVDAMAVEATGKALYKLIDEQALRKLVLDFFSIQMLSSSMLGVLLTLNKKSAGIGGKVILCNLRPELAKVFEITRLDKVLTFTKTQEEAIKRLIAFQM